MAPLDLICMGLVLALIAAVGVGGARRHPAREDFFSKEESNALRGFWCLVIILVHVPVAYQNPIQDAVGSFAYIGVTFFFMTSAYGLSLGLASRGVRALDGFWIRRLPKILVPCLLVNVLKLVESYAFGSPDSILTLLRVDNWVVWLLLCYLAFWATNKFLPVDKARKDLLTVGCVALLSVVGYVAGDLSPIYRWPTEIWGFAWGILLSRNKDHLCDALRCRPVASLALTTAATVLIGFLYLKCKGVPFFGDYLLKILLGMALVKLMLVVDSLLSLGSRLNAILGSISYEVYLVHGTVFSLVSEITGGGLSSGPFIAFSVAGTVLVAWVLHGIGVFALSLVRLPSDGARHRGA